MALATSDRPVSTTRLILIPALISMAVTILRLAGELQHWSSRWFSPETGGTTPSGVSWVVGITWLALPFGVYFALNLARDEHAGNRPARAAGLSVLGLIVFLAIRSFVLPQLKLELRPFLILIWLAMAVPAVIQLFGWPDLLKALVAYGLAARAPVVIIMFFAMRGDWGTHYDFVGMPEQFQMPLWPRFFWLAFFPQLIFWVGFTVLTGTLTGSISVLLFRRLGRKSNRRKREPSAVVFVRQR